MPKALNRNNPSMFLQKIWVVAGSRANRKLSIAIRIDSGLPTNRKLLSGGSNGNADCGHFYG